MSAADMKRLQRRMLTEWALWAVVSYWYGDVEESINAMWIATCTARGLLPRAFAGLGGDA